MTPAPPTMLGILNLKNVSQAIWSGCRTYWDVGLLGLSLLGLVGIVVVCLQYQPPSDVVTLQIATQPPPSSAAVVPALPTQGLQITTLQGKSTLDLRKPHRGHEVTQRKSKKPEDLKGLVVNLNTATAQQLQQLPGVGEKMAQRILTYRQQHGPFHTLEDLDAVKGLGPKKLDKMRPYVRF
jgi:comEA protein